MKKKKKIAFLHFQKTGGISIDNFIFSYCSMNNINFDRISMKGINSSEKSTKEDGIESDQSKSDYGRFFYISNHFSGEQFRDISEEFFKFTVIRDPYQRFKSHCLFLIAKKKVRDLDGALSICDAILAQYSDHYVRTIGACVQKNMNSCHLFQNALSYFDIICTLDGLDSVYSSIFSRYKDAIILSPKENSTLEKAKKYFSSFVDEKFHVKLIDRNQNDLRFYKLMRNYETDRVEANLPIGKKRLVVVPPIKRNFNSRTSIFIPRFVEIDAIDAQNLSLATFFKSVPVKQGISS